MKKACLVPFVALLVMTAMSTMLHAQGVLNALKPDLFKKVEADSQKLYNLTETQGPCLIFVTSFSGPDALQKAQSLVLEFRKEYKWAAYIYQKTFEHDASKDFAHLRNSYTGTKPRYLKSIRKTEYVVVIGDFPSIEDRQFKKTLESVRRCRPSTLKNMPPGTTYSLAYGLNNPLLPLENQIDPFVESINNERPYTLLRNPCNYTVKIATFAGGAVVVKPKEVKAIEEGSIQKFSQKKPYIEVAGERAAKLCLALRQQGVEAYEFHDRYSSYVAVGSFNFHSQRMPDGTIQMSPQVLQIVQRFQAKSTGNPSMPFEPVIIDGITCDIEPKVVEVPRTRR